MTADPKRAPNEVKPLVVFRRPDARIAAEHNLEGKIFPTLTIFSGPSMRDMTRYHGGPVDDTPAGRNEGRREMCAYLTDRILEQNE